MGQRVSRPPTSTVLEHTHSAVVSQSEIGSLRVTSRVEEMPEIATTIACLYYVQKAVSIHADFFGSPATAGESVECPSMSMPNGPDFSVVARPSQLQLTVLL